MCIRDREEIVGSTERALSNLVGLKIKVTENNQDKLNKINMVLQSVAKTWNGSTWYEDSARDSVNKKPTRNPASLLLEVLTSDTHKASQIKESEIDSDSFGELYEYLSLIHISEPTRQAEISYAVFCLKKKK